jgi:hypothetical protein
MSHILAVLTVLAAISTVINAVRSDRYARQAQSATLRAEALTRQAADVRRATRART